MFGMATVNLVELKRRKSTETCNRLEMECMLPSTYCQNWLSLVADRVMACCHQSS